MNLDLFDAQEQGRHWQEPLGPGALVLRRFALARDAQLLEALDGLLAHSPWRNMSTPGGFRMSVAMTNCGRLGWVSDRSGYRYDEVDPETGKHWPAMPPLFAQLAQEAAAAAGFSVFTPDACLINRYAPRTRLTLHQDRNEKDFTQPIVSVSLGLPAVFLFGGLRRADRPRRIALAHGDVVVWGGPSRMVYHGVLPVAQGQHPATGEVRINLTFRRAG